MCTKKDRVVDVLKVGEPTFNDTFRAQQFPFCTRRLLTVCLAVIFGSAADQGLIQRNILSVPVLLENGKWYGFLDMMVSVHRRTSCPKTRRHCVPSCAEPSCCTVSVCTVVCQDIVRYVVKHFGPASAVGEQHDFWKLVQEENKFAQKVQQQR